MSVLSRYEILPAEQSLWPRLAGALARLSLMKRYGRDEAKLARSLEETCGPDGPARVLWARDRELDEPAGLIWFYEMGTFGMGGYLKLLAVFPGHDGQGLGLALLRRAEKEVARRSDVFFLLVTSDNERAVRFYERAGYRRAGILERLVLSDADEFIYYKPLV